MQQPFQKIERRTRGGGAFSVIELLVATAIMSVIVFALYSMFNQTQKALRANVTQVDVLESGRAAMEMMVRELEQITANHIYLGTNLYAGLNQETTPVLQQIDSATMRTNVLQDFFFLNSVGKTWTGVGYRVWNAGNGVGTLYRFSVSTNLHGVSDNRLVNGYRSEPLTNASTRLRSPYWARICDGIIHIKLTAYDPAGRRMGSDFLLDYPDYHVARLGPNQQQFSPGPLPVNVILQPDSVRNRVVPTETRFAFLSNALPAYLELELGVLEPEALKRYQAMRDAPPPAAANFLKQQAPRVHLFRTRIPIRTAAQ
jgi:type II secretory pathway pseudopilin PulG